MQTSNGLSLRYAAEALRGDAEIVSAAVRCNGVALQYASEALRGDAEIVSAAVRCNGMALQYASVDRRGDAEIVRAAVSCDGVALQYASDTMRANLQMVELAGWSGPLHSADPLRETRWAAAGKQPLLCDDAPLCESALPSCASAIVAQVSRRLLLLLPVRPLKGISAIVSDCHRTVWPAGCAAVRLYGCTAVYE
eukprot:COSAG01_NODE_2860_length_6960_cov_3.226094_3_plen_195_part_00